MPHAVIRIYSEDRGFFDRTMRIRIRRKFRAIAEQCKNEWVVLYQSSRGSDASDPTKGYFATALIIDVVDDTENAGKCLVQIAGYDQLTPAQRMMTGGFPKETALLSINHRLKGWKAAEDVRVISNNDYAMLTGQEDASSSELNPIVIPRFRYDLDRVRDPKFSEAVYRAYDGRCAISGVSLLYRDGSCGLQAAHIYPFAKIAYNHVRAGILLAPSWHDRFDGGSIVINDDYSWSALDEDHDTKLIALRQLRLPRLVADWPDKELLRMKRESLGL